MLQEVENAIQHSPWEMMGKIVVRPEKKTLWTGEQGIFKEVERAGVKFTSERRDLDSSINVGLLVGITVS